MKINFGNIALLAGSIGAFFIIRKYAGQSSPTEASYNNTPGANSPNPASTPQSTLTAEELKLMHRDKLEFLFTRASTEEKNLIVNELTSRGYRVARSMDDPSFMKIVVDVKKLGELDLRR